MTSSLCVREGMIAVPGGDLLIAAKSWMRPPIAAQRVHISPFQVDRTEVTAAAYEACVHAGVCDRPQPRRGAVDVFDCNLGKSLRKNHPMNCLGVRAASAYCEWAGKRLPSSEEWE